MFDKLLQDLNEKGEIIDTASFKDTNYTLLKMGSCWYTRTLKQLEGHVYKYNDEKAATLSWKARLRDIKEKTHYCCKCGRLMNTTSHEYFLGRDCLGDHTETRYFWVCPSCNYEEER